eukprot:52271-Eustigmatos_ZCMA.PRE.1
MAELGQSMRDDGPGPAPTVEEESTQGNLKIPRLSTIARLCFPFVPHASVTPYLSLPNLAAIS